MSIISIKQIWRDTRTLKKEYMNEDKKKYKKLFDNYFYKTEQNLIYSKPLPKMSWCVHEVYIMINRYPSPVEVFFISTFDMMAYAKKLREDPIIREFTKLCFYIEENIKSYTSIDKDKGPYCVEQ